MNKIIIIIVLISILLSGCISTTSPENTVSPLENITEIQKPIGTIQVLKTEYIVTPDLERTIRVLHDSENNVTCWHISGSQLGTVGFSCIPDSQLK